MAQSSAEAREDGVRPTDFPLSIYIHIPFCSVRCGYCAFNTYTNMEELIPAYVDAVCRELGAVGAINPHEAAHSVYFGGGTPSLLTARQIDRLLREINDSFALSDDVEISLEANPDDIGFEYLQALRSLGINRLSIGMQSANADILRLFDRQHDLQAVSDSIDAARKAGFENVNLDVIFGSPGEALADWRQTVGTLMEFAPEHISMYGLELKGGTDLRQRVDAGELPRPDDDDFADMYEHAADVFERHGYRQYEISNWRRAGRQCRHNLQYWRNEPYIGVGAGAHGYAGGVRYSTVAAPQRYISALVEAGDKSQPFPLSPAVAKHTLVAPADDLYETVMMGLRLTQEGIARSQFKKRFNDDFVSMFREPIERLQLLGLMEVSEERVRLSKQGRLLSNGIIRQIVECISE